MEDAVKHVVEQTYKPTSLSDIKEVIHSLFSDEDWYEIGGASAVLVRLTQAGEVSAHVQGKDMYYSRKTADE